MQGLAGRMENPDANGKEHTNDDDARKGSKQGPGFGQAIVE